MRSVSCRSGRWMGARATAATRSRWRNLIHAQPPATRRSSLCAAAPPTTIVTPSSAAMMKIQCFHSEAAYHSVADETLETIQDALDDLFESHAEKDLEINLASGVLTISLPPHGTWVLNKQTPNRQIWWSSPLSGPRRYEFNDENNKWVYTRSEGEAVTLYETLQEEIKEIYQLDLRIDQDA